MQQTNFGDLLAQRTNEVPRSFIREILKVAVSDDIISFAGGLPNKNLFPVKQLQVATEKLFESGDRSIFQYSNTEGYLPLRNKIAERYAQKGLNVSVDDILITSGSQQALDLLGKVFIDKGDRVIIEEPGYLGAIQALSMFQPEFVTVPLQSNGIDVDKFESACKLNAKFAYLIPNFQNPSGVTYTNEIREQVADISSKNSMFIIEDDPYGDIRFSGEPQNSFYHYLPNQTVLLGTFSKTVVPSFRLGWIVAPPQLMDKLVIAKQAADLHTDLFVQRLIDQYISDNGMDNHIALISECYGRQAKAMVSAVEKYMPNGVSCTHPQGGMFTWLTLPEGCSAMKLFDEAIKRKVAFVPGDPFYVGKHNVNTCRLNFSCSNEATIEKGISILADAVKALL